MFILSDVHGEKGLIKPFLLSSEKYCFQLGDFGFIWKHNDWKYNKFLRHFERDYPEKVIFTVLGNHENYDSIEKMPMRTVLGARCRVIKENVFAVERGEVITCEGKNILCVGGADSTDISWRIPSVSWWHQEQINYKDVEKCFTNLEKFDKIDYVLSHSMPAFYAQRIFGFWPGESNLQLEKIFVQMKNIDKSPREWIGGHYHEDSELEIFDTKFSTLGIGQYKIY